MCKDIALTYLNDLGYNVIRYPRADILPLDVIGRQRGTNTRLGRLSSLMNSGLPVLPTLRTDCHAANIEARRSRKLDTNAALAVMAPYLAAMGAAPGASAHFRRFRSMEFVFSDVLIYEVSPAEVGAWLAQGEIARSNPLWTPYLAGDGELFVIVETLKSRKLSVAVEGGQDGGLAADTSALQAAVGAKLSVSASEQHGSVLSFAGTDPMVFGFKCVELKIASGKLVLVSAAPSAGLAFSQGRDSITDLTCEPSAALLFDPVILSSGLVKLGRHSRLVESDTLHDTAMLPEEDSPSGGQGDDSALLYVRLSDVHGVAQANVSVCVSGPLLSSNEADASECSSFSSTSSCPRTPLEDADWLLTTDAKGELLLDGCSHGTYRICSDTASGLVHSLRSRDLTIDPTPCCMVLVPTR